MFRRRFDELRLRPFLDYGAYRKAGEEAEAYRFTGGFESLTGGDTLWLRGEELTVPVALTGAQAYMLPTRELPSKPVPEGGLPNFLDPGEETPQRIRWNRFPSLTAGTKVFVGGALEAREGQRLFAATREQPLLVIFYDGPDRDFPLRTIRAGRGRNEYWNAITPYSLILGAFSQLMMVVAFLPRPAFHLTALTAFLALFCPLFPLVPPGLLLTILYRWLWQQARLFRSYRDLARLPQRHIPPGERTGTVPGGERYGALYLDSLPASFFRKNISLPIPAGRKKEGWYVFGSLSEAQARKAASLLPQAEGGPAKTAPEEAPGPDFPAEPADPFAVYVAIPGTPESLAADYARRAHILEAGAWTALLAGIGLNAYFIQVIVSVLF